MRQNKFVTKVLSIAMAGTMMLFTPAQTVFAEDPGDPGDPETPAAAEEHQYIAGEAESGQIPITMEITSSYEVRLPALLTMDDVSAIGPRSDFHGFPTVNGSPQFAAAVSINAAVNVGNLTRNDYVQLGIDNNTSHIRATNSGKEYLIQNDYDFIYLSGLYGDISYEHSLTDVEGICHKDIENNGSSAWEMADLSGKPSVGIENYMLQKVASGEELTEDDGWSSVFIDAHFKDKDDNTDRLMVMADFDSDLYQGSVNVVWSLKQLPNDWLD